MVRLPQNSLSGHFANRTIAFGATEMATWKAQNAGRLTEIFANGTKVLLRLDPTGKSIQVDRESGHKSTGHSLPQTARSA